MGTIPRRKELYFLCKKGIALASTKADKQGIHPGFHFLLGFDGSGRLLLGGVSDSAEPVVVIDLETWRRWPLGDGPSKRAPPGGWVRRTSSAPRGFRWVDQHGLMQAQLVDGSLKRSRVLTLKARDEVRGVFPSTAADAPILFARGRPCSVSRQSDGGTGWTDLGPCPPGRGGDQAPFVFRDFMVVHDYKKGTIDKRSNADGRAQRLYTKPAGGVRGRYALDPEGRYLAVDEVPDILRERPSSVLVIDLATGVTVARHRLKRYEALVGRWLLLR